MATIYMPLLNEGTEVWRPVEATHLSFDLYRVNDRMPDDEEWAYAPGDTVRCELTIFKEGMSRMTIVGPAK